MLEKAELKAGGLYAESQRERALLLSCLRRSEFGVEENPVSVVVEVEETIDRDFERDGLVFSFLSRGHDMMLTEATSLIDLALFQSPSPYEIFPSTFLSIIPSPFKFPLPRHRHQSEFSSSHPFLTPHH